MYDFTSNWHQRNHDLWLRYLTPGDIQYLEIGTHEGASLTWMLDHILTGEKAHATAIDRWENQEEFEARWDENIAATGNKHKVTKIKDWSAFALRKLPLRHFDVAYIDGGHLREAPLEDAVLTYRPMKSGGIMIFDDYDRPDFTVTAIDIFLELWNVEILHKDYQLIARVE